MLSHRMSRSKTYLAWCHLRDRCDNPRDSRFSSYGEVGISYPTQWNTFEGFLADLGEAPLGSVLDRIDPYKNYSKENCRWAAPDEQLYNHRKLRNNTSGINGVSFNRRMGVWLAYFGKKNCLLYRGRDFFEACCARKSWDATNLMEV